MAGAPKPKKLGNVFLLGLLVHDVSRLRQTVADKALKPLGITRSQFWVLSHLARHEGASMVQTELANALDLGKVGLGGLLDRLEANGLIVRVADKHDRRAKRIEMTPAGLAMRNRAEKVAVQFNAELTEGVTDAEIAMAEDILTRMKRRLIAKDDEIKAASK